MTPDTSPTARALLALEVLPGSPAITADRLAEKLSVRGPYGGYHVGRGVRLPPLMFSPTVRGTTSPAPDRAAARPDPQTASALVGACSEQRQVRLGYRSEAGSQWSTEVDPWAVVVRHGRWYLLCRSRSADAVRAYRVDRVRPVEVLEGSFDPPRGLDPVAALEEHLGVGWEYQVEIVVHAPLESVARCVPRTLGRLEPLDAETTRLEGSTSNPYWYAEQLAVVPGEYRIVRGAEVRHAVRVLGRRCGTPCECWGGDSSPAPKGRCRTTTNPASAPRT